LKTRATHHAKGSTGRKEVLGGWKKTLEDGIGMLGGTW